jgi:hypothetical protein
MMPGVNETPGAPTPETPAKREVAKPPKLPFTTPFLPIYEVLLSDPLGPAARGERRNLLAGSVTVLLVTIVKLRPEKIDSLGIRIEPTHLNRLGLVFFWVMVYFMVMFLGYAVADLLARVHEYVDRKQVGILDENLRQASIQQQASQASATRASGGRMFGAGSLLRPPPTSSEAAQVIAQQFPGIHGVRRVSKYAAVIRFILDFIAPVLIGLWALWSLWSFAHTKVPAVEPQLSAPAASADSLSPPASKH